MEDRTIDTIMLPKIPLTIAANNPTHRKRSIVYSLFGFFLLYKWNTYHAINAVSRCILQTKLKHWRIQLKGYWRKQHRADLVQGHSRQLRQLSAENQDTVGKQ